MRLRIGVVGLADAWQKRHAPALRALAELFEVRAVCDQVAHRARQAAAEFGATAMDGFRALLRREDVDAVLVLGSQWYGALPVLAACEAGKPVYCAAALELMCEEAVLLKQRVMQSGIPFVAELLCRQAPATVRLKELMATRLGPPRLVFCHLRLGASRANHLPGSSPQRRLRQQLAELVDWCCYVVDCPPRWVTGLLHHAEPEPDSSADYQMIGLDFSEASRPGTGTLAQISCGTYIPGHWEEAVGYRPPAGLEVCCAHGVAFVDLPAGLVWFDEAGRHQEALDSERPVGELLLKRFHRAVTAGAQKSSDLEDVFRAISVVEQARRSHGKGRRLRV